MYSSRSSPAAAPAEIGGSGHRVRLHRTGSIDVDVTGSRRHHRQEARSGEDLRSRFNDAETSFASSRLDASHISSYYERSSAVADADGSRSFLSQADPDALLRRLRELRSELSSSSLGAKKTSPVRASKHSSPPSDKLFDRIDKDGDGTINKREMLLAMRKSPTVAHALGMDQKVKEGASRDKFESMFQAADSNDDRVLSREEFSSYLHARGPHRRQRRLLLQLRPTRAAHSGSTSVFISSTESRQI